MPTLPATTFWSLRNTPTGAPPSRRSGSRKRLRTVHLGSNVTLLFEDEATVRYQIQEMLRIERTFDGGHPGRAGCV